MKKFVKNCKHLILSNKIFAISAFSLIVVSCAFWVLYAVTGLEVYLGFATGLLTSLVVTIFFVLVSINERLKKKKLLFENLFFSLKGFEKRLVPLLYELNDGEYDIFQENIRTKDLIKESGICDVKQCFLDIFTPTIFEFFLYFQSKRTDLLLNEIISQKEFEILSCFEHFLSEDYDQLKSSKKLSDDTKNRLILDTFYILSKVRSIKGYQNYTHDLI